MFDDIISNKYFVIALVIALLVVLYLYSQKKSCDLEGMKNIDLSPLPQNLVEGPWTTAGDNGKYKTVNNTFDKKADAQTKKNLQDATFLKRSDVRFREYIDDDSDDSDDDDDNNLAKLRKKIKKYKNKNKNTMPKPLDNRPDLSQCQPCICPGGKKGFRLDDLISTDSDFMENDFLLRKNKSSKNKRK